MWWSHGITSDAVYAGMLRYCNFTTLGPLALQASTLASDSLLLASLQSNVDITVRWLEILLSFDLLSAKVEIKLHRMPAAE